MKGVFRKQWLKCLLMLGFVCVPLAHAQSSDFEVMTSYPRGTLSFDFQSIDLRTLLQLIAKSSGQNFVISDAVKGNVTLNLKNVTWQQALKTVLESHGLAQRTAGNVVYVSTIEDITSNETKQMQSAEALSNLEPLTSTIVHLKYTNATDLANMLKGAQSQLLTARGQVAVDLHTNSVILRDIKSNLKEITKAIHQLDIPAKQVLIEARIINIDVQYEKELGARFGISHSRWMSGNFFGANSLAQDTSPAFVATPGGTIDPTQRLNFNNPAPQIFTGANPGTIGMAVTKIGGVFLDLELSALEGEEHATIVSTPKVMTSNQQKATIQTGEEIPYQSATSSGATSVEFKNAVLSLEITPQITPDNKIILSMKATQDSRGANVQINGGGGTPTTSIPAINTEEVDSNIILNDCETVVLGGIYKVTKDNTVERIPFFGSLPLVGGLFRHVANKDQKTELLIFITPKIIKQQPLAKRALAGPFKGEG